MRGIDGRSERGSKTIQHERRVANKDKYAGMNEIKNTEHTQRELASHRAPACREASSEILSNRDDQAPILPRRIPIATFHRALTLRHHLRFATPRCEIDECERRRLRSLFGDEVPFDERWVEDCGLDDLRERRVEDLRERVFGV